MICFFLFQIEEQCLRYLSILLSQVVHQSNKKGSLRERLHLKALEFTERFAGTDMQCDTKIRATFNILRDLVKFFDEYHEQKYQQALATLRNLQLVPLNVNELEVCINNFKRYENSYSSVHASDSRSFKNDFYFTGSAVR